MERKSSWWPRAGAWTGLLFLAGSGCLKDFDALSAEYIKHGGAGGHAGKGGASGHGGTSGHSPSAGTGDSAGDAGAAGGEGDTGGTGATSGGANHAGGGGKGGTSGQCAPGLTVCPPSTTCTNLAEGDPEGNGVTNCGECGTTCSLDNASSAKCEAAVCKPTCQSGFANCNADDENDGCEAGLTTIAACGACGKVCSTNGTTSQECVSGTCTPTCAERYSDCNAGSVDPLHDDGCEVYLDALGACTLTDGCNGAHVACSPLQVCNAGSCVAPQGVAVLSTPLSDSPQKHRFADLFPTFPNLEGTVLTVRAYAPGATGGSLVVYFSDDQSVSSPAPVTTELKTLSDHWVDVTISVVSQGSFNAKKVKQVNIELWGGVGPWIPMTVVYVDSVRTANSAVNDKFDANYAPMVQSTQQTVPGSTLGWLTAVP